MVFYWYSGLISHTDTSIQRHRTHLEVNRVTHPYKYVLTPPVMCSQQIFVLHCIIHWYQKFAFFHNIFSFQKLLVEVMYLLIEVFPVKHK